MSCKAIGELANCRIAGLIIRQFANPIIRQSPGGSDEIQEF